MLNVSAEMILVYYASNKLNNASIIENFDKKMVTSGKI